jgi:hypothetical protein
MRGRRPFLFFQLGIDRGAATPTEKGDLDQGAPHVGAIVGDRLRARVPGPPGPGFNGHHGPSQGSFAELDRFAPAIEAQHQVPLGQLRSLP